MSKVHRLKNVALRLSSIVGFVIDDDNPKTVTVFTNSPGIFKQHFDTADDALNYFNDLQQEIENEQGEETNLQVSSQSFDIAKEVTRQFNEMLDRPIADYPLSIRALSCLRGADIYTMRDLIRHKKTDLLRIRNFGKKTIIELDDFIHDHNLEWGMDV